MRTALLAFVIFGACGCGLETETRHRELWRIPHDYHGWIYTHWSTPPCAALPISNGYLVIEVPPNGVVCTSSTLEEGVAKDRFVYVLAEGGELELPMSQVHERIFAKDSNDLYVFIGTSEEFGQVRPSPPARYGP